SARRCAARDDSLSMAIIKAVKKNIAKPKSALAGGGGSAGGPNSQDEMIKLSNRARIDGPKPPNQDAMMTATKKIMNPPPASTGSHQRRKSVAAARMASATP